MEIMLNDTVTLSAGRLTLLLAAFGEELLEKIENGEIDDTRQIMAFARDKTVEIFEEKTNEA